MSDIPVTLVCPSCRHSWLAAILTLGAWWMEGSPAQMAAKVAQRCHCVKCQHEPPMEIAA